MSLQLTFLPNLEFHPAFRQRPRPRAGPGKRRLISYPVLFTPFLSRKSHESEHEVLPVYNTEGALRYDDDASRRLL